MFMGFVWYNSLIEMGVKSIIMIDDDMNLIKSITFILYRADYFVISGKNQCEAVNQFTDWQLPAYQSR